MLSPLPCLWKDGEYQTLGAVIVVRILTDSIAGVSELPGESQLLQQRVIWTKRSFAAERAGICMPLHILLCLLLRQPCQDRVQGCTPRIRQLSPSK